MLADELIQVQYQNMNRLFLFPEQLSRIGTTDVSWPGRAPIRRRECTVFAQVSRSGGRVPAAASSSSATLAAVRHATADVTFAVRAYQGG